VAEVVRPIELPVEGIPGDGIRIRVMADQDVTAIVEACRDPEAQRFTTVPSPYREEDAYEWSRMSAERAGAGMGIEAVIADEDSGAYLGSIGIRRAARDEGRWNVGYLVSPSARGGGVALRALQALSAWAFAELGALRLELVVEPDNAPSRRVAEKAGFHREGLLRSYLEIRGERRDALMYSLLPADVDSGRPNPGELR
jgi:ribosomal-protein-alanine N-acetyltransferase